VKGTLLVVVLMTMVASPACAQDTITVGMTVSRTGSLNVDSVSQLRGAELWRDEVNAKGGIEAGSKRYKVNFVEYDDQSQGGRVQQLYTRLILEDKSQFLLGPYSSGLTATAAVITEQYGTIMLDGGGAEAKIFELGNKYLFQVLSVADQYLSGAIAELKQHNPHAKVAFVYSDDPFSKAVVAAARKQAEEAGFTTALDESYPPSTTDFTAIINKIISSGADSFLGGGHYQDGATLARQMYDQKAGLKWVTILVAPDSDKFATLGAAASGITVPSQWEPQVQYKPDFGPTVAQFTAQYRARFNDDPDYHAATGYAEGLLLERAIEHAGSIDREKVTAELNKIDTTTFFGRTKFATDPAHHGLELAHDMVLAQWQMKGGKLVKEMVWPDAAATAKVVYPLR
jgi:branched-chain amino acid transport system substrate-binding protein